MSSRRRVRRKIAGILICWVGVLSMAGCAVCKSSDSPDVCRTKQRDHSQPRL